MDNLGSRETLKLLKISDDSNKNNSDLDLPEITNQRKRKVRRKHRHHISRLSSSSSNSNLNNSSDFHGGTKISSTQRKGSCSSVLVLWFTFIMLTWLITLSYMISVIHSENLRLQTRIKKLEGNTQNSAEVHQSWHETSKYLQDNQTQINSKIVEYHKEIENLTIKLDQLLLDSSSAFTKKDFAEFGAEVKSGKFQILLSSRD